MFTYKEVETSDGRLMLVATDGVIRLYSDVSKELIGDLLNAFGIDFKSLFVASARNFFADVRNGYTNISQKEFDFLFTSKKDVDESGIRNFTYTTKIVDASGVD